MSAYACAHEDILKQSYNCLNRPEELGKRNCCIYVHEITSLREESSQTNVILQYKLLAEILSAVCSVI